MNKKSILIIIGIVLAGIILFGAFMGLFGGIIMMNRINSLSSSEPELIDGTDLKDIELIIPEMNAEDASEENEMESSEDSYNENYNYNPSSKLIEGAKLLSGSKVYSEPTEESDVVCSTEGDLIVIAQRYDNDWTQVKVDNALGWVKSSNVLEPN
ncbi:MAG: hypothetical protein IKR04_08030 [Clostridia bacterium]|nr:hypothetical protein [Clostridia bacterium]